MSAVLAWAPTGGVLPWWVPRFEEDTAESDELDRVGLMRSGTKPPPSSADP